MLEKREDWNDIVAALGERSVKAVAGDFDTTPGAITSALMRTGTTRRPVHAPGAPPPPKAAATPEAAGPATVNGLHVRAGTKDHKIAELSDILGDATDAHVADLAGVSARTVAAFRRRNGIKGRRGRRPSKKPTVSDDLPPEKNSAPPKKKLRQRGKPSKLDTFAHLLGPRPDAEVAAMAGVSANAAAAYRRRRGLPSHRQWKASQGASEAPTETKTAPPARTAPKPAPRASASVSGASVYRVSLPGGESAFVVADDLVSAAQNAARHGATGLELAGALLA